MNKLELEKVNKFIDNENFDVEVEDFNNTYDEDFEAGGVQVTLRGKTVAICYQTSTTSDLDAMSSQLELNNESESTYELSNALEKYGFSEDFIEKNFDKIENLLAKKHKVQERYDAYMKELGEWERDTRGMDANSEIFVLKED